MLSAAFNRSVFYGSCKRETTRRAYAADHCAAAAPAAGNQSILPAHGVPSGQQMGQTGGQTDTVPLHRPCCILREQ